MPVQRKIFRIEEMSPMAAARGALSSSAIPASYCEEILAELRALHDLMQGRSTAASTVLAGTHKLHTLPDEKDSGSAALSRIKTEIAALRATAFGSEPNRLTCELEAVANGAELSTQVIIDAAENIEDAAQTLAASVKLEQEQALALDIQDHVLRIFEACNFQDIGGQRIAKALAILKSTEERFACVLDEAGSFDANQAHADEPGNLPDDVVALHGPRLTHDHGHATQEDIDKLFVTADMPGCADLSGRPAQERKADERGQRKCGRQRKRRGIG
jgi:chemotaxis protein CheZ